MNNENGNAARIADTILIPFQDRLVVEEDRFRTGYECTKCDGDGLQECFQCKGTQKYVDTKGNERECQQCTKGKVVCTKCHGNGATVVVPEIAKKRPTTGIVRAIGPDIKNKAMLGTRVLYSNFSGHAIELTHNEQKIVIRWLFEQEILGGISTVLKATDSTADFTAAQ